MGCALNKKCSLLVLVGSARKKSANYGLVHQIENCRVDKRTQVELIVPLLEDVPLFNEDEQKKVVMSQPIASLRDHAQKSNAILIVTPQINGSTSPLVLNAFLWLSRSYSKKGSPLLSKKAGVISASYLSENQIMDCLQMGKFFNMRFMSQSYYLFLGNKTVNEQGKLVSAAQREKLQKWYKEFIHFVLAK